jgi:phenylacetate-CoA ligase
VTIHVEARAGVAPEEQAEQGKLLSAYIKDVIGISARTQVAAANSLARSTGKASHVRDLRPR